MSLSEQLPPADVNYLLSTNSVDTNSVDSLIYLAQRIRTIRSPVLREKNIRNVEIWIVINLIISEHRLFQQKAKSAFRLAVSALALLWIVCLSILVGQWWR